MGSSPLSDDVGAMAFVQAAQLCAGLPEMCLSQLFETGVIVEHEPESVVVQEGDDDQGLFMILEGSVAVQKAGADGDIDLAVLERPAIFGEVSALTEQPRSASVIARGDLRCVHFPGDVVRAVADTAPKFGRRLAILMAGRAEDTQAKLDADSAVQH